MHELYQYLKQNKRGSVVTEYLIILVFIGGLGLSIADGSLVGAAKHAMHGVYNVFNSSSNLLIGNSKIFTNFYNGSTNLSDIQTSWRDGHFRFSIQESCSEGKGKLIDVEPNTSYQIVIDLTKIPEGLSDKDVRICAFLWDDPSKKASMDTGDMDLSGANRSGKSYTLVVDEATNTATYTFTTNAKQTGFGMNIVIDKNKVNEANKAYVANNYTDMFKLEKL